MALSLGNPNIAGSPEYIRRASRTFLFALLPYYLLGIGDGFFLPYIINQPLYFVVYDVTKFVVIPSIYLVCLKRWLGLGPSDYFFISGRINYKGWEWVAITLFSALFLDLIYYSANGFFNMVITILMALLRWILSPWFDLPVVLPGYEQYFSYAMAIPDDRILHIITALFYAITAGVVEEIFFRGLLRQVVAAMCGPHAVKTFIFGSATIFGLAHWEQGSAGLIAATAFGLGAAWIYLKLGDLRPLILAHALIDLYIFW